MKKIIVICTIIWCFSTQPFEFDFPRIIDMMGSESLSDPNQSRSPQELLDMFRRDPPMIARPIRPRDPTPPEPRQPSPPSGSGETLSDPRSNLSQQELLSRFSERDADEPTEVSERQVRRTVTAETDTQADIAQTAQNVLPASELRTLTSSRQTISGRRPTAFFDWFRCFFKRGLTWRKKRHDCSSGLDFVGCVNCNPYRGDTQCYHRRPILCIYKANDTRPDYSVNNPFYEGWSGGHIKITKPIRGCYILSKAHADHLCRSEFGHGWRMASHHDGHYIWGMGGNNYAYGSWNWGASNEGGWNFYAYGDVSTRHHKSYWTYIRNQPGNCWN